MTSTEPRSGQAENWAAAAAVGDGDDVAVVEDEMVVVEDDIVVLDPGGATPATRTSVLGVVAILAATACWSLGGVLAKKADLPGVVIAFWRALIVAAVFGAIAVATKRRLSWAMVRRSALGGALFGVNLAVWFQALHHASVGIATVMSALTPVLAMFAGARFLGEKVTRTAMLCAAGAIAGVVIFVVPGFSASGTDGIGLGLAALAIGIWVCYLFVTKRAREGVGTIEYLLCMSLIAAVTLIPVTFLLGESLRPPTHGWGWLLLLALLPGCLGHGLLTWAQPQVDLSTASVLLQGEPVGAAIAGVIFLDESMGFLQAGGLVLAFVALSILARQASTAH